MQLHCISSSNGLLYWVVRNHYSQSGTLKLRITSWCNAATLPREMFRFHPRIHPMQFFYCSSKLILAFFFTFSFVDGFFFLFCGSLKSQSEIKFLSRVLLLTKENNKIIRFQLATTLLNDWVQLLLLNKDYLYYQRKENNVYETAYLNGHQIVNVLDNLNSCNNNNNSNSSSMDTGLLWHIIWNQFINV